MLDINKVLDRKYIRNRNGLIGYKSGTNFANSLRLTTQTASVPTIITNNTDSDRRIVVLNNKKAIVKKSKIKVDEKNYKVLQVLDLMTDFEKISEVPMNIAKKRIQNYLKDKKISKSELTSFLDVYPTNTKEKMYESGVFYEITYSSKRESSSSLDMG